jgi:hypothetical protein
VPEIAEAEGGAYAISPVHLDRVDALDDGAAFRGRDEQLRAAVRGVFALFAETLGDEDVREALHARAGEAHAASDARDGLRPG